MIHENDSYVLKDMFEKERKYNYKVFNITNKKGKNVIVKPVLIFYTFEDDGDDTLRYVEDATEEIVKLHDLYPQDLKVYESRGEVFSHIEMRYDSKRFRGTSWVNLTSEEKAELLAKIL